MHVGIVLFMPWAIGITAWGGFAYLVREWRMLQLTVSLLCLVFLPTLCFLDESPRWLAVRGQHRRALRVLQKAARWNGVALPPTRALLLLKDRQWDAHTKALTPTTEKGPSEGIWMRPLFSSDMLLSSPRTRESHLRPKTPTTGIPGGGARHKDTHNNTGSYCQTVSHTLHYKVLRHNTRGTIQGARTLHFPRAHKVDQDTRGKHKGSCMHATRAPNSIFTVSLHSFIPSLSPRPSTPLDRTPRLRTITLSLYTNYLLVGVVYFGLSLSGGDLSSDPFLYMALTGVVELPAYTLVIPVVARFGRRAPVVAFFFVGAVALLALPFVPAGSMVLALIGKMSVASAFQILDFYCIELFPTEVRTRGLSTAHVMSRVGSTCSPFITDYLGPLYPWAPSAVFGAASVVAGLATLALPETLHVPLPDTVAHLEERQIRTSGFLRLPVRDPRIPSICVTEVD
ncbi:solute carrier family 22 member 19-like [Penaeus japonicus]|uniref:solute carrier family 22 member 19-like n=1 Tax=Penaeus japonicus TaxID=27405 RepID=UPI001C70DED7|nr:solute carrier family 22 member 19-like [Penaeus japonicus]